MCHPYQLPVDMHNNTADTLPSGVLLVCCHNIHPGQNHDIIKNDKRIINRVAIRLPVQWWISRKYLEFRLGICELSP